MQFLLGMQFLLEMQFLLGMQFLPGMCRIQKIKDSDLFEHRHLELAVGSGKRKIYHVGKKSHGNKFLIIGGCVEDFVLNELNWIKGNSKVLG